jgi:hypothetical protein
MPLTTEGRNDVLTNGLTAFTHLALLDASGTEIAGGSYARQAVAFDAAASGARVVTDAEAFSIPAGNTVAFSSFFDALSAGNEEAYAGIGTSLIAGVGVVEADDDAITSKAHGLVAGNRVHVWAAGGGALPAGLSVKTAYYVVTVATDTFELSLTEGGASVNITTDGELAFQQTKPETFGSDGTLSVPDGSAAIDLTFA